mgnify:CR=1 FL=1
MNKSKIFEIIKKELRDIIRDKKTITMMIILPLLLYPVLIGALSFMMEAMANQENTMERNVGFLFEPDETLDSIMEMSGIKKIFGNEDELKEKLTTGEVCAYLSKKEDTYTIHYSSTSNQSNVASNMLSMILDEYNNKLGAHVLIGEGIIPDEIFSIYNIQTEEVSGSSFGAEYMLNYIPSIIIMMSVMTAGFAAIDMTAGEKERGTLETLLTFPITKFDIIGGKFIANLICTSISSILGFLSMYSVLYILSKHLMILEGFATLSFTTIILILIAFVCFAVLISALTIMVTSKSKSFKEAQNSIQPLTFISMAPMFLAVMGTKITMIFSLIPFLNII